MVQTKTPVEHPTASSEARKVWPLNRFLIIGWQRRPWPQGPLRPGPLGLGLVPGQYKTPDEGLHARGRARRALFDEQLVIVELFCNVLRYSANIDIVVYLWKIRSALHPITFKLSSIFFVRFITYILQGTIQFCNWLLIAPAVFCQDSKGVNCDRLHACKIKIGAC